MMLLSGVVVSLVFIALLPNGESTLSKSDRSSGKKKVKEPKVHEALTPSLFNL